MDKTSQKGNRRKLARLFPLKAGRAEPTQPINDMAKFPARNPYPVLRIAKDGIVLYSNQAGQVILEQLKCKQGGLICDEWLNIVSDALSTKRPEEAELECDGRVFLLTFTPVEEGDFVNIYGLDTTGRKQAEEEREVMIKLLSLINSSNKTHELMRLIAVFLKDWSDCEAVGMRLKDGEDFPYFVTSGFSDEFVKAGNRLCSINETGELVRDCQGRVFLECMCGNIISGRFDPSKSFFTRGGSFWTNSTTELLASTNDTDRLATIRNRCNTAGYESVAIIPLRAHKETFGLLQFNDKGRGRFTSGRIALFERLADNLAVGLSQRKAEEALQQSEVRFRELFESMGSGVAVYEAVNNGEDFIFKDMNKAGEHIEKTERAKIIGERVTDAFPGVKEFGLFDVFQRVWRTGEPEYHPVSFYKDKRISHWVENYVYKLPSGEIVTVYDDVTQRKQAEEKMTAYQNRLKSLASQLALSEEHNRRRIAVELHDNVGQSLAFARLELDSARQLVSRPELAVKFNEISKTILGVMDDLHTLSFDLSSPVLREYGLEAVIADWLDDKLKKTPGLHGQFIDDGLQKPLDEDVKSIMFRSVRELATNVIKHASASQIKITAKRIDNKMQVVVEDNGIGFDVDEAAERVVRKEAFGLFSIQEQLSSLGGQFKIVSQPGSGTKAILTAPLKKD